MPLCRKLNNEKWELRKCLLISVLAALEAAAGLLKGGHQAF